jgi:hypothetical protein
MSLLQDLGARLHASSAELPLGELVVALDKLRAGSAMLSWVREQSRHPMGVPELARAAEHLENAAHALRVAQDGVAAYLAAIGLGPESARPPETAWRRALDPPEPVPVPADGAPPVAPRLRRWWAERVAYLTDGAPVEESGNGGSTPNNAELLRRVARHTRAADRDGLRRELTAAPAPVGLGLSATVPAVLQRLAADLLGHQPRAEDLPVLTRTARGPVQALLPKLPPGVLDTLLARVCRVPPEGSQAQAHPADSAVTGGVLVGVLLHRLGRDPDTLDPTAPEPVPPPEDPPHGR